MTGEPVDGALTAIAARNRDLRAFLAVDATAATRPAAGGRLRGLIVGAKDAFRTTHLPTTFGTNVPNAWEPGQEGEAHAVGALRRAGAVVIGKTNCGELCMGEYVVLGPPANPAAPGHTVSGSSGGCAVAVAAALVDASICTDTGGSARIPAAFCGVLGLKLTTGSGSLDGAIPLAPSLDALGVIARSVDTLRNVAGELGSSHMECESPTVGVVHPHSASHPVTAEVLETLATRVATKVVAPPDLDGWRRLHRSVVGNEAREIHGHLLHDDRLGKELRTFLAAEPPPSPGAHVRDRIRREVDRALGGVDVLVTPAVDGPPPRQAPPRDSDGFWRQLDWLAPLNHSGHPALVVPIAAARPPLALQLVARHGDEAKLFAVAAELQG